jgi:adenylate cyclase
MAETRAQRRLAAILAADVVGYSRLMEVDEAGTLAALKARRREVLDPRVAKHQGRIFKVAGDSVLVEFASAVNALQCAVDLQQGMAAANAGQPEALHIVLRIGVNLGDVIVEGSDLYGEGVNIAARLEAIAEPGGVLVSGTAHDHVRNKVKVNFDDLGVQVLRNIAEPVHAYRVSGTPRVVVAAVKATSDKPSIAILPFTNMSGEPEQEYFSDGITEDVITDLSKVSALGVIARNTSFQFKGKSVDVRQIARQLKVSHILEGSVRKAGGRVRITAQLNNGASGEHVWAERYDRDISDIFALQDEISEAIVKALKLNLLPKEKMAIERRGTSNLDAYDLYLIARQYYATCNYGNRQGHETIIRLCRSATAIDANYARAWALMAIAQMNLRFSGGTVGESGLEAAERALALDMNLAEAHAARAWALTESGRYGDASDEIEAAIRLDPESYEVNRESGRLRYRQRRFEDAICYFERAGRLMEAEFYSVGMLMSCYTAIGDSDGARRAARHALDRIEKIIVQEPDNGSALAGAFTAVATLGEVDRAKALAKRAINTDPDNLSMRYNIACALIIQLGEFELALTLLDPVFENCSRELLNWTKSDPDFDPIRENPRFKTMLAAADARLAAVSGG